MQRKKAIKLAGFVGALAASATLVSMSVSGTGAYFTDSHDGTINAGTGKIKVLVSPSDGQLTFDNLLPGEYKTQQVHYTASTTGTEDVWLVFPTGDGSVDNSQNPSEAFTGHPEDADPGALGRYGHFALASDNGAHFTSYNLANHGSGIHDGPTCTTDSNGWGGSNDQPTSPTDTTTAAFCAPPNAILLASNLSDGQGGTATLTFGFTPLLRDPLFQGLATAPLVHFKIVATQHGIRPDNQFNG